MGCSAGKHMTTSPEVSSSSHSAKENGCSVHTPGENCRNVYTVSFLTAKTALITGSFYFISIKGVQCLPEDNYIKN